MRSITEVNNNTRTMLQGMQAGLLAGICNPIIALYRKGDTAAAQQLYKDKVEQHVSTYPTIEYDMSKYITRNI